jgi:predicted nucleic acid-binding protein
MKYLFDTNVISEIRKENCNENVKKYTMSIDFGDCYLSAVTVGEVNFGIEKLPPGPKRHDLYLWLYNEIIPRYEDRIVPLDMEAMLEWGKIRAAAVRTLPERDMLIAAVAVANHFILVTRNTADFEGIGGLNLYNPWE